MILKQFLNAFSDKTECSIDAVVNNAPHNTEYKNLFDGNVAGAMAQDFIGKCVVLDVLTSHEKLWISCTVPQEKELAEPMVLLGDYLTVLSSIFSNWCHVAIKTDDPRRENPILMDYVEIYEGTCKDAFFSDSPHKNNIYKELCITKFVVKEITIWQNVFYIRAYDEARSIKKPQNS